MSAVDFGEWAAPDLVLRNLGADSEGNGGRTFVVRPPSVNAMTKVMALAVRGEVELRMVTATEVPAPVQEIIDSIGPDEHPALGATFDEMRAADIADATVNRAAYYAIFYWARGKEYADALARLLWSPREEGAEPATAGDASRKS